MNDKEKQKLRTEGFVKGYTLCLLIEGLQKTTFIMESRLETAKRSEKLYSLAKKVDESFDADRSYSDLKKTLECEAIGAIKFIKELHEDLPQVLKDYPIAKEIIGDISIRYEQLMKHFEAAHRGLAEYLAYQDLREARGATR